eukprot:scaffold22387_cov37-Phaeocystis_antarctica.AAC.4
MHRDDACVFSSASTDFSVQARGRNPSSERRFGWGLVRIVEISFDRFFLHAPYPSRVVAASRCTEFWMATTGGGGRQRKCYSLSMASNATPPAAPSSLSACRARRLSAAKLKWTSE